MGELASRARILDEIALGAMFLLSIYTILLYHVNTVDVSAPLLSWLPPTYWLILPIGIALLAHQIWSDSTGRFGYLVLFAVVFALFLVPEIIETGVRVRDSYSYVYLASYVTNPTVFNNMSYSQIGYLQNWPGFAWLVAFFDEVTGLGYYTGAKILLLIEQLTLLVVSLGLGRALFKSTRGTLISGCIALGLVWDVWSAIVPQLLGEILFVVFVSLLLLPINRKAYVPLTIVFAAATISHGITAIQSIAILVLATIVAWIGRKPVSELMNYGILSRLSNNRLRKLSGAKGGLIGLFIIIFAVWFLLEPTAINSYNLISSLNFIFGAGTSPLTSQLGYLTPARYDSVLTAAVYLALIGFWVVVSFALSLKLRRTIDLSSILILILVSGLMYVFLPTSQDFYDRFFQAGFPFLLWFLSTSNIDVGKRLKTITTAMIILTLVLGFTAGYSHEATEIYPLTENSGASFILSYTPQSATVSYLTDGPTAQGLSDLPQAPLILELTPNLASIRSSLIQSQIIVDSGVVRTGLYYYFGSDEDLETYIRTSSLNLVYQNGLFDVYSKFA